jgi:hypothetical protein
MSLGISLLLLLILLNSPAVLAQKTSSKPSEVARATTETLVTVITSTLAVEPETELAAPTSVGPYMPLRSPSKNDKKTCPPLASTGDMCEYRVDTWCSTPLYSWPEQIDKNTAYATCKLQVAGCFRETRYPEIQDCHKFRNWCSAIKASDSKAAFLTLHPPRNTTNANIRLPKDTACHSVTVSTPPDGTRFVLPQYARSICKLPTGPKGSGFDNYSSVGHIAPPVVTCNDNRRSFRRSPFKVYVGPKESRVYKRSELTAACQFACEVQHLNCVHGFVKGRPPVRNLGLSVKSADQEGVHDVVQADDDANTILLQPEAFKKCQDQLYACQDSNLRLYGGDECKVWDQGW